jgi:hypothetical protein
MMVSLSFAEAVKKYVEARLDACRHADELTRPRQSGHRRKHAAHPVGDFACAFGEANDPHDLAASLPGDAADLLDEAADFVRQGRHLLFHLGEDPFRSLGRPAQGNERWDQRDRHDERAEYEDRLGPEVHGLELWAEFALKVNKFIDLFADRFL